MAHQVLEEYITTACLQHKPQTRCTKLLKLFNKYLLIMATFENGENYSL